mmetsp:Transcript_35708/g.112714  ORF Transcript_35708/g.112714 Transcript_35708/m.112714 type:complete len:209 (+) Transcript_35708:1727-2353(+)
MVHEGHVADHAHGEGTVCCGCHVVHFARGEDALAREVGVHEGSAHLAVHFLLGVGEHPRLLLHDVGLRTQHRLEVDEGAVGGADAARLSHERGGCGGGGPRAWPLARRKGHLLPLRIAGGAAARNAPAVARGAAARRALARSPAARREGVFHHRPRALLAPHSRPIQHPHLRPPRRHRRPRPHAHFHILRHRSGAAGAVGCDLPLVCG